MELVNQYNSAAKSLNEVGHKLCVAIAVHAYQHSDWTVSNQVFQGDALEKGGRRDLMVKWLEQYAGLIVSGNKFVSWQGKEYIKENLDTGKKNPFYKMDKGSEDTFKGSILKERLQAALSAHSRAIKQAKKRGQEDKIDSEVGEDTIKAILAIAGYQIENLIIREVEEESKEIDLLAQTIEQDKAA